MDLRQLRYFSVLAEELHFRRAAERLNITQAPLSVAIQGLERELGAQLLHRTQRRVALTEPGLAFREHALAILDRVDRSVADIGEMVSGQAGRLRIGFTAATSLLPFFTHMISDFRRAFPRVELTLRDLSSAGQVKALQAREIDVAFLRGGNAHPPADLTFTKLLRDPLVVAMHQDNPLSAAKVLSMADLRNEPFIFYPPKSGIGIYDQIIRACARHGFSPYVVQEAHDASTIIGLAATGLGVAIVPSELQCIGVASIVYRPLSDEEAMTELFYVARSGEASATAASIRRMAQAAILQWHKPHTSDRMVDADPATVATALIDQEQ